MDKKLIIYVCSTLLLIGIIIYLTQKKVPYTPPNTQIEQYKIQIERLKTDLDVQLHLVDSLKALKPQIQIKYEKIKGDYYALPDDERTKYFRSIINK